jgi:KDO2-lipid IV(A) lauroyltransferase
MVELLKPLSMKRENFIKRISFKNPEILERLYNENKSVIMYSAHYGNWEWFSILTAFMKHQFVSFYFPQSNKYFDELMKITRERFGAICVESNKGYKVIVSNNQKHILTLNCIIGDQSPNIDSTKHWIRFLNQDTAFLIGADRIAKKSNQVVMFPIMRIIKRGYYEFELRIIEENPAQAGDYSIIEKYAQMLEETITAAPELWLWSHRRWKLKRSD